MSNAGRVRAMMNSVYMEWAKLRSHAPFNLATSGIINYSMDELRAQIEDIEINGPVGYGYQPLLGALAARYRVDGDCVVEAAGTSFANHLAMASVLQPNDEVLIEQPGYEPLVSLAAYLGAQVTRFARRAEDGFRLDLNEIERAVTARTRLIVLTNLHNPSSVLTADETLRQVGEVAQTVGAHVLVDEVYLETLFERAPRTAVHLGAHFIATNSLTKAYGLSGLRCGWVLAEPQLAKRMWRLNDLFGVNAPHATERLSLIALNHLAEIARRAHVLLTENRRIMTEFLDTRDDLETVRPQYGTTVFPRLVHGDVREFCRLLREKYETSVVPGDFFGAPAHFRIGIGGDTETLIAGLERLSAALDDYMSK
jgi:aspartate/methionine/tyrosine aminotransferase